MSLFQSSKPLRVFQLLVKPGEISGNYDKTNTEAIDHAIIYWLKILAKC